MILDYSTVPPGTGTLTLLYDRTMNDIVPPETYHLCLSAVRIYARGAKMLKLKKNRAKSERKTKHPIRDVKCCDDQQKDQRTKPQRLPVSILSRSLPLTSLPCL